MNKIEFPQVLAHPIDYSPQALQRISSEYRIEPKYDGIRLIGIKDDQGVRFLTRSKREITAKLDYLVGEFEHIPTGTMFDGELTLSMNGNREELGHIQRVIGSTPQRANAIVGEIGKPVYNVFDVLWFNGKPVFDRPLKKRLWELEEIDIGCEHVRAIEAYSGTDIEAAFKQVISRGGEGIVIKDLTRRYHDSCWIRWKEVNTVDLVVMGFNPPSGRYAGKPMVGSLIGSLYDPTTKMYRRVASIYGLSDAERRRFYEILTQDPQAKIVVEAKYSHRFPSGGFRFCSFLRIRDDKAVENCI